MLAHIAPMAAISCGTVVIIFVGKEHPLVGKNRPDRPIQKGHLCWS